ncbi:unnamed protein product [Boreogadus saida]
MEEKGLLPFADSSGSMNCDMDEKGIVLRELSCRTAASALCRSCGAAEASAGSFGRSCRTAAVEAVRQGEARGGSPAEKGILLLELICGRVPPARAARPLVHKILAML